MTGAEYSAADIEQLGTKVQEDVASPFAALRQRAEDNRIPDGAFTLLQPGDLATEMTTGIIDRLQARLQEFEDGFGDMSDLLHKSASTYQTTEDDNTGDSKNIHSI